jgi:SIR2-like domain
MGPKRPADRTSPRLLEPIREGSSKTEIGRAGRSADKGNSMSWELLTKSYKKSGIVLALGAGVSIGAGLPNWTQLLERLTSNIDDGPPLGYDQLIRHNLPPPIVASILEELSGNRKNFVERVRKALYRDFPFFPEGLSKGNRQKFVRYLRESNPTLHSVASLCAVPTNGGGYQPNPRIRGIVTFNLDALLQNYVYARFGKRLLRTVERASASSSASKISIYHLHGFLRFDRKAHDPTKEAWDTVVLTEQDYFDFFNDPTGLFSYTFFTCFAKRRAFSSVCQCKMRTLGGCSTYPKRREWKRF